jgi:uncharacterized protein
MGKSMIIALVRLPVEGLRFEHQYEAGELDVSKHEFELTEAPHITGRIKQSGMDVRVTGDLSAALTVPCDRCLQAVPFTVGESFNLVFVPVEAEHAHKGETELHGEDLEFSYYANDELDIDQLIREQLELALPARVLCRTDCCGLCPQCGADLNVETCQCPAQIDPRWQALAELKNKLEEQD